MAALAKGRNIHSKGVVKAMLDDLDLPVAANKVIYQGALVCLNSSGYLEPMTAATGKIAAGVAMLNPNEDSLDTTGLSNGDKHCRVRQGVFGFVNSGTDPVAQADVGKYCWGVDDQTIAKSSNSSARSKVGVIVEYIATGPGAGVYVAVGLQLNPAATGAAT